MTIIMTVFVAVVDCFCAGLVGCERCEALRTREEGGGWCSP
jgi:hypothetical protein